MKKWIIAAVVCIVLLTLFSYLFVPNIITINKSVFIENNLNALRRSIANHDDWRSWWPDSSQKTNNRLSFNGNNYSVKDNTISTVFVNIQGGNIFATTSLNIIPGNEDSIKVEWAAAIATSYNPINRFQKYVEAKKIEHDFSTILTAIKNHYSTIASVYKLDIKRDTVKNAWLVFTYDSSKGYPSTEKIYAMADVLKKYIISQHAVITDSPMLNIYTKDSLVYLTRVGVPTDRKLPSIDKIQYRWMLGGGNILTARVSGDQKAAEQALAIVQTYVTDYQLIAPAIPFFSLETNRLAEKESSKWVTKIYYPIMYFK
jgi:hypothetical protein